MAVSAATAMLAATGAVVWKVEDEAGGDPLRRQGPFGKADRNGQVGLPFAWTGRGKRWIGIDGGGVTTDGSATPLLRQLAAEADVVITSDARTAGALSGGCRIVCVTPFGIRGPRSTWKASGFGLFHASGTGFVTPRAPAEGSTETPVPQAPWGNVAAYFGAIYCAIASDAAARREGPVLVDLSLQECLIPLLRRETGAWLYQNHLASRSERLWRVAPSAFYATSDGYVYVSVIEDKQWRALCRVIDREDLLTDARLATAESRFEHLETLNAPLEAWFSAHATADVFSRCGQAGIPVGQVLSPRAAAESPQLRARNGVADAGELGAWPVLPFRRAGGAPLASPRWDDPRPGRDTDAVLRELGWDDDKIAAERESGAIF